MSSSIKHGVTLFRGALIRVEELVAAVSLLSLLVMVLIEVLARNLFNTGFPDMEMVMRYLVLYVGLIGAVLATERVCHIKCDVISVFISIQRKETIRRPLFLLSAMVCAVLSWHASRFWWDEWSYAGDHIKWVVPMALILPVGFGLLALHFTLSGLMGDQPDEDAACQ